jgi:5-methylcytosine-specific restriction endonuclease McrA
VPYFLLGDEHATDPMWNVLAEGNRALRQDLKASFTDLMSTAAHHTTDGYLTQAQVDEWCTRRVLALLTMSVLDRSPKVHKKGDECECLGDTWITGYSYRIHKFLKRNPSRKERDRNAQQKADLRNTALKHAVWERDGYSCRYCRSGVLKKKSGRNKDRRKALQFDHVDPDQPAGDDGGNFVTACARCNEYKGRRTPDEADMVLLPVPTAAEVAQWLDRGPAVFDLHTYGPGDHRPITDGSTTEQQPVVDPDVHPVGDPPPDAPINISDQTTAEPRPETDDEQHEQRTGEPAKGPGRVGEPRPPSERTTGPGHPTGQPVRGSADPDIYHGRARPPVSPPTPPPPPDRRRT